MKSTEGVGGWNSEISSNGGRYSLEVLGRAAHELVCEILCGAVGIQRLIIYGERRDVRESFADNVRSIAKLGGHSLEVEVGGVQVGILKKLFGRGGHYIELDGYLDRFANQANF